MERTFSRMCPMLTHNTYKYIIMIIIWPQYDHNMTAMITSHQAISRKFSIRKNHPSCVIAVEHEYHWPKKLHQKHTFKNKQRTHNVTHISVSKERIKEKYAENGAMLDFVHEHKMSCLKCLNFSKENNMIKLAEKHEKCWSNTFASATCLNSLLEKIIINQHCFKYYRSLNIPNAGLFAINSLYWSLKYW